MTSFADMYGGKRFTDRKRNENDYYPTPPFATYSLIKHEPSMPRVIWEPACGKGHMVKELRRNGFHVTDSDLESYADTTVSGTQAGLGDFITMEHPQPVTGVVTNPPYSGGLAQKFVQKTLEWYSYGAFLCRMNFVEGAKRHKDLFSVDPPTRVHAFVNRFSCWEENFDDPLGGMVNFAWWVWDYRYGKTKLGDTKLSWIDSNDMFKKWKEEVHGNS